jgi:putative transferase (TIGR04331 family)
MNLITLNIKDSLLKKKKFKKNSILIGDWCDVPNNIFTYKKNYRIAKNVYKYHTNYLKKKNEINYIGGVYNKILDNLSLSLNKYHKEDFNKKYWEILVHRWLYFYVAHMFSRWQVIKKILNNNPIKSLSTINFGDNDFRPTDTWHAHNIMYSSDNYWNTWIFTEIIKENYKKITIDYFDINKKKVKKKIKIYSRPIEFYDQINIFFSKKIFLYKFYMSKFIKLKIFLHNFQFFLSKKKKLFFFSELNNKLDNNFIYTYKKSTDKFYNFVNKMIIKNIPRIFIEDYERLKKETEKLNWPEKPDFILTTHGQYYDEVFKLYAAKKIIKGSNFLIAQHGSVNITANTLFDNEYDKKISDRYLTWGWKDSKKTYPLYITTTQGINEKSFKFLKNKKILLILYNLKHSLIKLPNGYLSDLEKKKLQIYMNVNFLKELNHDIFSKINAKILSMENPNVVKNSILCKFPKLKFIKTNKLAYTLRNKFNLQIETYLSTGFLEAMHINRPVILLFNERIIDGVNKSFKKYINLLQKNNIIFTDPKKAANFINREYFNIQNWWNSSSVQQARKKFCHTNCRHSNNPTLDFNKSLLLK